MKMDTLWEESLGHRLKVERNLNFSTISNEDDEFGFSRKKTARDPMSHRIIEKRRRDRMNNCLADLSRLVPTNYLKKGRGRIEKTEIIEMAIKHLKHLQAHPCKDPATCEVAKATEQDHKRQYRLGFHECMSETVRFLVEIEGLYAGDGLCVRLVNHLQKHYDKVVGGVCYTQALGMMASEDSKMIPMEIEHTSSCFPADNFTERSMSCDSNRMHHSLETKFSEETLIPDLKKEDTLLTTNSNFNEVTGDFENQNQPKPPSQLREMLQNPGLPKDRARSSTAAAYSPGHVAPTNTSTNGHIIAEHHMPTRFSQNEEVYKFKNNIKHRFNADLCHHTSSQTDSHSDQISLPDDERTHVDSKSAQQALSSDNHTSVPLLFPETHLSNSGLQQQTSPVMPNTELCIKIPEQTAAESTCQPSAHPSNWDCNAETASSCGSNPSPPPAGRSNGSSSGYSTNGETTLGSKIKAQTPVQHSPALSPYSRTPDHLSNHSSSPQPIHHSAVGVPIFALHPKGTFYIPLTIDSNLVTPYLAGLDELTPVLHPVSICVNFSLCNSNKIEKLNGATFHFRGHSLFMDRFSDRYLYVE